MKIHIISFSLVAVAGMGCRSMESVTHAKNEGISMVYPVSRDRAWEVAKRVLIQEGCGGIDERKEEGAMFTSTGMTALTYGTYIGVWVEPIDRESSKVTVCTKRKVAANIATGLTETTFHNRFAQLLY